MQRTACNFSIFVKVLLRKISEMFSVCSGAIFTPEAMRSRNLVSTCSAVTQMRNLVSRTQILKWCFVVTLKVLERDDDVANLYLQIHLFRAREVIILRFMTNSKRNVFEDLISFSVRRRLKFWRTMAVILMWD